MSRRAGQAEGGQRQQSQAGNATPAPRRRPGWQWALLALFLGALAVVQFIPA